MKEETVSTITSILSSRLQNMVGQIGKVAPSAIAGLTAEIDTTSATLTDFIRNQQATNVSETNAAFVALDLIAEHQTQLEELNTFFEQGAGKGGKAHKMIKGLLKVVHSRQPETLTNPI